MAAVQASHLGSTIQNWLVNQLAHKHGVHGIGVMKAQDQQNVRWLGNGACGGVRGGARALKVSMPSTVIILSLRSPPAGSSTSSSRSLQALSTLSRDVPEGGGELRYDEGSLLPR